jgi:hypothetical protein
MKWERGKKEERPKTMDPRSERKHDPHHDVDESVRRSADETRTSDSTGTDDAHPTPD